MVQITTFDTRDDLMGATASYIADALNAGAAVRGRACAALSGGSTPEPAYEALAAMALEWPGVTFALVDERFVPPDHPASNEAMLRRALAPALRQGAKLAPMYAAAPSAADAALLVEPLYAALHIDVALMGMGEDGHTASWFAGAALRDALDPANPRTVIAQHAPRARGAPDRLTLTRAAIARADNALLLITGDRKRARLEAAFSEPHETAPVAALFEGATPQVYWAP